MYYIILAPFIFRVFACWTKLLFVILHAKNTSFTAGEEEIIFLYPVLSKVDDFVTV